MAKKLVETTVYSLSNDAPAQPDRRQGDRYVSVLRVGALIVEGRRELCLIRNLSAGGMMIRPYSSVTAGTRVSVELKHGETVTGTIQWADKSRTGIRFDAPIDVLALLSPTSTETRPRMPRVELSCIARLHHHGQGATGRVVNVSQGGVCVSTATTLPIDGDVVVTLAGLSPAAGVVKWRENHEYGIRFNRVLALDELMAFLREQQRDEQQRAAAG